MQALKLIADKEQPSAEWLKAASARLQEVKKANGEMEIAIISEIEALVTKQLTPEPATYPAF